MDDIVTRAKAQNIEIKRQNSQQCLIPVVNTKVISDRLKQNMRIIEMINKSRFSRSRQRRKQQLELSGSDIGLQKKGKTLLNQIATKLDSFMKQSSNSLNISCRSHSLNNQQQQFQINRSNSLEKQIKQVKQSQIKPEIQTQIKTEPLFEENTKEIFRHNLSPPSLQERYNFRSFEYKPRLRAPLIELQNHISTQRSIRKQPNSNNYVYRKYLKPQIRRGLRKSYLAPQIKGKVSYICPVYLKPYKSFQEIMNQPHDSCIQLTFQANYYQIFINIRMINFIKITQRLFSLKAPNNLNNLLALQMSSSSNKPFNNNSKDFDLSQNEKLVRKDGVLVNQERIRAKMKQIKQKRQMEIGQRKKKQQKEFMKNYQIIKEPSKVQKFRRDTQTQDLFNIQDVSLDEKPTTLQITSFSSQFIDVDNFFYPPSIIMTPNQLFLWQIKNIYEIKVQHLKMIELITPVPQYIIIGCDKPLQIPIQIRQYLQKLGINYDISEMFEAVSNFNTFANDDVKILAFFWCGK